MVQGGNDVDPTCRYDQKVMPDSIFGVNIAHCVTYG